MCSSSLNVRLAIGQLGGEIPIHILHLSTRIQAEEIFNPSSTKIVSPSHTHLKQMSTIPRHGKHNRMKHFSFLSVVLNLILSIFYLFLFSDHLTLSWAGEGCWILKKKSVARTKWEHKNHKIDCSFCYLHFQCLQMCTVMNSFVSINSRT